MLDCDRHPRPVPGEHFPHVSPHTSLFDCRTWPLNLHPMNGRRVGKGVVLRTNHTNVANRATGATARAEDTPRKGKEPYQRAHLRTVGKQPASDSLPTTTIRGVTVQTLIKY
jgi:hypothetical protein